MVSVKHWRAIVAFREPIMIQLWSVGMIVPLVWTLVCPTWLAIIFGSIACYSGFQTWKFYNKFEKLEMAMKELARQQKAQHLQTK